MKKLLALIALCSGCASSPPPAPIAPPLVPCPAAAPVPACSDKLMSLSEEELKAGVTCPANSRLVFPSAFYRSDKMLVMCQCRQ